MKRMLSLVLIVALIFCNMSVLATENLIEESVLEEILQEESTQRINLAYLKPITASSQRDNFVFVCNAANDGNLIQRWEPGEVPCWIMVDLEQSLYFDEIAIYTIGSMDDYVISGSDDGDNWFTITDSKETGAILSGDFTVSIPVTAKCRYVKLEVNESDMGEDFAIYEMEIYAPAEKAGEQENIGGVTENPNDSDVTEETPELLFNLYPRDTAQNRDRIRHLANLGIIEGFDDDTFRGNREVSRGEFVKSAVKLLNLTSASPDDAVLFADVPKNHAYYKYIGMAVNYGMIAGDGSGNFRPDDAITVPEAVKIIVEALGYKAQAIYRGGYPTGYFTVANSLKLLREFPKEGTVKRIDLVNLIYRAMNTEMASITSLIGDDAEFSTEKTVLERCFEIYKDVGVVYADGHSSFEGKSKTSSLIKINDQEYSVESYFPELFVGNRVEFYYKDGDILSAERYHDAVMTEIDRDDIEDLSDTAVRFDLEGRTETISFSDSVTIVYNGSVLNSYDANELIPEYGRIRCMDWDGDEECDVLYIDDAVQMKVGVVNSDTVVDADHTDFRMTIKGDDRYIVFQDEKPIEMPPSDSILTVFADKYVMKNGVKVPDTEHLNLCRIEVSQKKIEGQIESVLTAEEIVIVDGVEYRYIPSVEAELNPGSAVALYLDYFGTICHVGEEITSFDNYAYFIGVSSPSGLSAPQFKIFDQEKVDVVSLDNKVKINGSSSKDISAALQRAGLTDASGDGIAQLIKIRKNSAGKISAVYTAVEGTDFELGLDSKDTKLKFFKPAGSGYSFFSFMLDENAKIFDIPKESEDAVDKDYKMCTVSDLVHRKDYYVQAYNLNDVQRSDLIVLYRPSGEMASTSVSHALCVVKNMTTVLNEDGEAEPKLEFYQNGALLSKFIVNDELKAMLSKRSTGDILLLAFNDDGEIAGAQDVFLHKNGGIMLKITNLNNANSYLLPAFGKVVKVENNSFLLDRSAGLPEGDTTAERILPYYAGSAVCLIFDCERNQLKKGTVSDMLAANENDALFVRGNMAAPKEMVLYKGYYN